MTLYSDGCPKTDIQVLVYNNESILPAFFNHLYKNTNIDEFNLIIVDNNSKRDHSVDFIKNQQKKYSNIIFVQSPVNLGVAGGRNLASKNGSSDYIINLDSDQHVTYGWLKEYHAIMKKGFDFVSTECWTMNPPSHPMLPYFPSQRLTNPCHKGTYLGGGGCLMKREVFEKLGGYDEQFLPFYFEDSDLSFSASKNGYRLGWNWKTKIIHLGSHTKTAFSRKMQFNQSYERFKKKWFPYYPSPINMIDLERMVPGLGKKR